MSEQELISTGEEDVSQTASIDPSPSVGLQLKSAREAKGLSVADAARALKLSVRQVEALEGNDWAQLPGNTIVRGFVRNYARLLELDPATLMQELDRREVSLVPELDIPAGTNVRVPQEGQVERRDYVRVISGVIVLLLALLAYFFVPPELWQSTLSALKSATQSGAGLVKKSGVTTPEVQQPAAEVVPAVQVPAVGAVDNSPPAAMVNHAPVPVVGANKDAMDALRFSFKEPSWVEVRDRSGEVVFSELCQAGSQQVVNGKPPFLAVIGNASTVTLTYKGKPVDLSKRSKDDVARVTVE